MPRLARKKSNSGVYHIIMRGINRQIIFENEEDYDRFIQTMKRYKEKCEYELYAYCLMDNHLHLLLKEGKEPLEFVMRRICSSYVFWYNKKYERTGYLFQDRYRSEPVEDNMYLLTVIRYIFQNPIKAGLVSNLSNLSNYKWTNYMDYVREHNHTDIDLVLNIINTDRKIAVREFINYINQSNDDKCMEITERQKISDEDAKKIIRIQCKMDNTIDLQKLDKAKRNMHLRELKKIHGLSIKQIERLTGINRGIVQRA